MGPCRLMAIFNCDTCNRLIMGVDYTVGVLGLNPQSLDICVQKVFQAKLQLMATTLYYNVKAISSSLA